MSSFSDVNFKAFHVESWTKGNVETPILAVSILSIPALFTHSHMHRYIRTEVHGSVGKGQHPGNAAGFG